MADEDRTPGQPAAVATPAKKVESLAPTATAEQRPAPGPDAAAPGAAAEAVAPTPATTGERTVATQAKPTAATAPRKVKRAAPRRKTPAKPAATKAAAVTAPKPQDRVAALSAAIAQPLKAAERAGRTAKAGSATTVGVLAKKTGDKKPKTTTRKAPPKTAKRAPAAARPAAPGTTTGAKPWSPVLGTRPPYDVLNLFGQAGRANVIAYLERGERATQAMERLRSEMLDYAESTVQTNFRIARACLGARTLRELFDVQAQSNRETVNAMLRQSAKMTGLSVELAQQAAKPMEELHSRG